MLRLVRMLRLEGKWATDLPPSPSPSRPSLSSPLSCRYVESFTLLDDLILELRSSGVLGTAGFIGVTIWFVCSAFYYLAERHNPQMIYCPACDLDEPEKCEGGREGS